MNRIFALACLALAGLLPNHGALAQDTAVTYQGRLQQSEQAYTGTTDLTFRLYDQAENGNQVGTTLNRADWPVSDGLFQVDLDFGAAAFDGQARYLEVAVDGTVLVPRQAVRPAPVALFALAGNEGPQGPQGEAGPQGPPGLEGEQGASPFVLEASTGELTYQASNMLLHFLPVSGGSRITMGSSYNQATEVGAVALGGSGSSQANVAGSFFATVGGGAGNSASGDRSTVSGGSDNQAVGTGSFIGGGYSNATSSSSTVVAGGNGNSALGGYAAIAGGKDNTVSGSHGAVGGGEANQVSSTHATVSGGEGNAAAANWAVVGGGQGSLASGISSTVGGGSVNTASQASSTVAGGSSNTASGNGSSVPGGVGNCAGGAYSLAVGRRAKVRIGTASGWDGAGCDGVTASGSADGDAGTFVWADSQDADFTSTGPDQFLVRAAGGVGINTRDPKGVLAIQGATPLNPSVGQFHVRSEETTGAVGTGAAIVMTGHNGQYQSHLGAIQLLKENSTVGDPRATMKLYVRGTGVHPDERMRIDSNGVTYNGSGSWSTFSDRRLKKDIEAIDRPLERLLALQGVRFEYRDPEQVLGAEGPRLGFIAQQVEEVFPEWVGENEEGYKHVTPAGFEALAVEALRELEARDRQALALIEARLQAQDERAARLEGQLARQAETLELMLAANRALSARNAELMARLVPMTDREPARVAATGSRP